MNGLSASTIIVSIMAAIGIAPVPPVVGAATPAPAITAARAAILQDAAIVAPSGLPVLFRQA
jgi:hypothetical protein